MMTTQIIKPHLKQAKITVKSSPIHGYGVFSDQFITCDSKIEECLAVVVAVRCEEFIDYYFNAADKSAIALGFGCFYNHAAVPNATYYYDTEHHLIIFKAIADIQPGEEITISYGQEWFDSRLMQPVQISIWHKWWHMRRFFPGLSRLCAILSILAMVYFFLIAMQSR